jgi:D-tyrosyl-tRNA(Tyr) deacylase
VFEDADDKMNLSVHEVGGAVLAVSQFTLLGDARKGNRPSFMQAMPPTEARGLFDSFCDSVKKAGIPLSTGRFRAQMEISLVCDGPVTILIDTQRLF